MLSPLKVVTPLGKWEDGGEAGTEVWRAVSQFRGSHSELENTSPNFGFEYQNNSEMWTPLPDPEVFIYGEGLDQKSTPAVVSYQGQRFDLQKHELLFDATKKQLVILYRLGLDALYD